MGPLRNTFKQRENCSELGRCGFTVVFPSAHCQSLTTSSAQVLAQDSLARTFGLFTMNIASEISGHMCWWTSYYPGKFAPMLSNDPEVVKAAMLEFQQDCLAFWSAKAASLALGVHAVDFVRALCFQSCNTCGRRNGVMSHNNFARAFLT